jgi:hypothetical protein
MKRIFVSLAAAMAVCSCGMALFESVYWGMNLDSTLETADAARQCSMIRITNKLRASIKENGDSVRDTGRSIEMGLMPVVVKYRIFNSAGQTVHYEGSFTSEKVPYGGSIEIPIEFGPNGTTGLQLPYYKAEISFEADDVDKEDHEIGTYSLSVEEGEGQCGTDYHYSVYNWDRDREKLVNQLGTFAGMPEWR